MYFLLSLRSSLLVFMAINGSRLLRNPPTPQVIFSMITPDIGLQGLEAQTVRKSATDKVLWLYIDRAVAATPGAS